MIMTENLDDMMNSPHLYKQHCLILTSALKVCFDSWLNQLGSLTLLCFSFSRTPKGRQVTHDV